MPIQKKHITIGTIIATILFAAAALSFIYSAAIKFNDLNGVPARVDALEADVTRLNGEEYLIYKYIDTLAKKILTSDEYRELMDEVHDERELYLRRHLDRRK